MNNITKDRKSLNQLVFFNHENNKLHHDISNINSLIRKQKRLVKSSPTTFNKKILFGAEQEKESLVFRKKILDKILDKKLRTLNENRNFLRF